MRIIYNNKEVSSNTRKYATLINKPVINGVTIEGNVSLDSLHLYNKEEVEHKLDILKQVYIATDLPVDPVALSMYYIGPDEEGIYKVYLIDYDKSATEIGTTQFGQYKGGPGINVKVDNTININTDDNSILIDSEGKLKSSLDPNQLEAFTGATASTDGTRGLVPAPRIADRDKLLLGDGTWGEINIIDTIYPVGSLLIMYEGTYDPNTLFDDTTWTKLDSGYVLWMKDSTASGTKIDPAAPNVKSFYMNSAGANLPSMFAPPNTYTSSGISDGCLSVATNVWYTSYINGPTSSYGDRYAWSPGIDFSRNNKIFSDSEDTVQPPAYKVIVWQRTA